MKYTPSLIAAAALALSSPVQGVHAADIDTTALAAAAPPVDQPPRPENQLLNLPPTTPDKPRIVIEDHLAWPKEIGDAVVALWRGNATGAVSFVNDDSFFVRDPMWLEIGEKYPTVKLTHFPSGPEENIKDADKEAWRKLVAQGHEVQSHTYTHRLIESMEDDCRFAIPFIEQAVPGHKVVVMAGAGGKYPNDYDVAAKYYAGIRHSAGFPNRADLVNYRQTASFSGLAHTPRHGANNSIEAAFKSLYDTDYTYWGQKFLGGWTCVHFHGLGKEDDPDKGKHFTDMLDEFVLPAQKEGKLWVARFSDIILYGQSRDTAKVEVTRNKPKEIAFLLTDRMCDQVYDRPLTVKVRVPADWKTVTAKQAGKPIEAKLVKHEGNNYALVEAIPDRGETVLTP